MINWKQFQKNKIIKSSSFIVETTHFKLFVFNCDIIMHKTCYSYGHDSLMALKNLVIVWKCYHTKLVIPGIEIEIVHALCLDGVDETETATYISACYNK